MVALKTIYLEKTTGNFIDALSAKGGPPIYKLTPTEARALLENVQSDKINKPQVDIEEKKIKGPKGDISIRIMRSPNAKSPLPVILFIHGAGWVMGSANTHDKLVRELVIGSNAALVFVNYSRSPEARFPKAIEEAYAALKYVYEEGKSLNLDPTRLAVAGDSVGGNMTIAITLLAKERRGPKIDFQVLFYPVTKADLSSQSYHDFSDGPWLTKPAMQWFWDAYESNVSARSNPLMSPLNAPIEQLKGLPPALVITAENDVLRDEGEAYAHHLMEAGVSVVATRFLGTIHDFVMLNALANTPAAKGAISLANTYLHKALHRSS